MSEWLKEHAWKARGTRNRTKGSNPFLSASLHQELLEGCLAVAAKPRRRTSFALIHRDAGHSLLAHDSSRRARAPTGWAWRKGTHGNGFALSNIAGNTSGGTRRLLAALTR